MPLEVLRKYGDEERVDTLPQGDELWIYGDKKSKFGPSGGVHIEAHASIGGKATGLRAIDGARGGVYDLQIPNASKTLFYDPKKGDLNETPQPDLEEGRQKRFQIAARR